MSDRKRWPSAVSALFLLVTLVPASPAAALTSRACPTTVPSAGFRDLEGLIPNAVDAIDCVAFYRIALGTSGSAFSPNSDVARWQMALFLTRAASAMGVTLPNGSDQGFTDLVGVGPLTTTAINQLKQLGITQGTGADTFDPFGTVPRWQMALFLIRLADTAGIPLPSGASQGFTDVAVFDAPTQTAINQLKQLGITEGAGPITFDPLSDVVRWQMALFLAREIDVGGAIPYRITISTVAPSWPAGETLFVFVAVENPNGSPAPLRRVDFWAGSINIPGQCVVATDVSINDGPAVSGAPCIIDSNDLLTNNQGVVTLRLDRDTIGINTIFAWTGETGETFNRDLVRGEARHDVTWVEPATALTLPDSLSGDFGTSISVRAEFARDGSPVALFGQPVRFQVSRDAAIIYDIQVLSAADGSATFTYTGPSDPGSPVSDTITAFWDRNVNGLLDGPGEFVDTTTVTWHDNLP